MSALGWLRTVCRHMAIDVQRRSRYAVIIPFDEVVDAGGTCTPQAAPLELAQVVIDAFIERVDARLASRPRRSGRQRLHAIVALRRLALDHSLPEITAQLGLAVSPVLLTKWVERGRNVIVETVESESDHELADFYEPFATLARERRADAGIPRPSRRKHN